jgi:hypothetical protein
MPHEFTEWEKEAEPLAGSTRGGGPPQKITGFGVLDPPVPPKKRPTRLPPIPASWLVRVFAAIILIGFVIGAFLLLLR